MGLRHALGLRHAALRLNRSLGLGHACGLWCALGLKCTPGLNRTLGWLRSLRMQRALGRRRSRLRLKRLRLKRLQLKRLRLKRLRRNRLRLRRLRLRGLGMKGLRLHWLRSAQWGLGPSRRLLQRLSGRLRRSLLHNALTRLLRRRLRLWRSIHHFCCRLPRLRGCRICGDRWHHYRNILHRLRSQLHDTSLKLRIYPAQQRARIKIEKRAISAHDTARFRPRR